MVYLSLCVALFGAFAIAASVAEYYSSRKTSGDATHCASSEYVIRMEWMRREGHEVFGTHYTTRVFAFSAKHAEGIAEKWHPGYDFYCSLGTIEEFGSRFERERRTSWLNT
jgi:hypothetical protein